MSDPYAILGLAPDSDDDTIRRRYLDLVKQYTPEHQPRKFAEIRAAYDSLRDLTTRLKHRLFGVGKRDSLDVIIEELECQSPRRRIGLDKLLDLIRKL